MRFFSVLLAFLIVQPLQGSAWAQSTTDAIISQAPKTRYNQLIGNFPPQNAVEKDILAAALLDVEAKELYAAAMAGDAKAKARRGEIANLINAYDKKHEALRDKGTPFGYQWRILSGQMQSGSAEYMIPRIRILYHARQRSLPGGTAIKTQPPAPEGSAAWQQYEDQLTAGVKQAQQNQQAQPAPKPKDEGSFFGTLFSWIFWLGLIGGGIYLYRKYNAKRHQTKLAGIRGNFEKKFGTTQSAREKKINEMFDAKSGSLNYSKEHKFKWSQKSGDNFEDGKGYVEFTISRDLVNMAPREREFLRFAYLLYNQGLIGEEILDFYEFAFMNGDGKAAIKQWEVRDSAFGKSGAAHAVNAKDGPGALRFYQNEIGGSVDAAANALMEQVQELAKGTNVPPIVEQIQKRLSGGSAWLNESELAGSTFSINGEGVTVGDLEASGRLLCYTGEGSMITVAPPGSGKTQCHVFPTLLTWPGPAVVLDVKGEIYEGTSKWRSENVGPVYKFSPLDPANSHCYNPLTAVRSDPDYLWEDARFLADMMMVPTGAKDPFWENRARDVLTAAIAKVCLEEDVDKRSMGDVLDVFHGVGWDSFVRALQARVDIRSMSRAGNSLGNMDAKTRDGVLQTGLSSLSAWDGDRIARATKRSDWSPLDLRSGNNPTVYICLKPNEVESYISVLRVFIAQHIRMLTTELPPRDQLPILFVLDELPRLRQMPPVEEALEIGRQYGIKLWMFTQSIGQLQNAYPNADGMIGSCAVRMYMNPSLHDETAQKISDDIGMQESVLDGSQKKIVEPNILAGPDYKDFVIVMAAGMKPMRLKKHFAYQDEAIRVRMGRV